MTGCAATGQPRGTAVHNAERPPCRAVHGAGIRAPTCMASSCCLRSSPALASASSASVFLFLLPGGRPRRPGTFMRGPAGEDDPLLRLDKEVDGLVLLPVACTCSCPWRALTVQLLAACARADVSDSSLQNALQSWQEGGEGLCLGQSAALCRPDKGR